MTRNAPDLRILFQTPQRMSANPHYYDYIHFIEVNPDQTVRMVDGGGQALHRRLDGRVGVISATETECQLRFFELREVDPYQRRSETKSLDEFLVQVTVEPGPFLLKSELVWNVAEEDHPWLLFEWRLLFSSDPLRAGLPSLLDLPPEVLAHPELCKLVETEQRSREATRRYYLATSGVEIPQKEALRRGLPIDQPG